MRTYPGNPCYIALTEPQMPSMHEARNFEPKIDRSIFIDLSKGISKSKIFRAVVITGISTISILTFISPPGWLIAAAIVGTLITSLLIQLPGKGKQKLEFEISAISRLFKTKNYHKIYEHPLTKGTIFLGALPNRLQSDGEHLIQQNGIQAVLSVNESWERSPLGLSLPYKRTDWKSLGVQYDQLPVEDHTLLDNDKLEQSAKLIHEWITEGKNVYVHCRAGKGRSAMAVAAYLIKHAFWNTENPVNKAISTITSNRYCSTIGKKKSRLLEYFESLKQNV